MKTGWGRAWPWVLATSLYSAFAVQQTWPLITRLGSVLPHDLGDPVLNTWIIWWNAHTLPFTAAWWNAPAFWPSQGALAFSEVLLGLTPITAPVQWLGGGPIAAYNIAFLLTFPLSGLAAHALAYRLTGRHDAALIGGLVYGFNPFRVAHFPQLQVMASFWMPVALWALHEYIDGRRKRWLALFGAAWLLQALSNGYYLLFFPVLLLLWIVWFALSRQHIRAACEILVAWAVASLPLVPLLWTYRRIHAAFSFHRDLGEVSMFGADLTSLLDAAPLLRFWKLQSFHQPEGELFPGLTAALLVALIVVVRVIWTSDRQARVPLAARVLLGAGALFVAVGLSSVVFGPWSIEAGSVTLLSVRVASKPLSIGGMLLLAAFALIPRFPGAWRRRSPLLFYVLAMAAMYLLCFGPRPHVLGEPFMARGPYGLLMLLPGYASIRVPARFAMLAVLCVSVVSALAFAKLTAAASRGPRLLLAAVAVGGILVDSAIGDLPLRTLPPRLAALESRPGPEAVLELPMGNITEDVDAMYRGMFHGRPVVNGYSGFFPKTYEVLRAGFSSRDPAMFDAVAGFGPLLVVLDTARDSEGRWASQLAARSGAVIESEEAGRKVFSLPAGPPPPTAAVRDATRLPLQSVTANVHGESMALALDGNEDTRWESGPQNGAEAVTVDLGGSRTIDAVTMTLGSRAQDYPRKLIIESSDDGAAWTIEWEGSSASVAFAAALNRPGDMRLTYQLSQPRARQLRLRQLGHDPMFNWTIFELAVYGQ